MMKGVSGGAVIALIMIVAVVGVFFYICTPGNPYASYCPTNIITPIQFKNDIITIEDSSISTLNPYPGSMTTIDFFIQNNGDKPVDNVELNFFDLPGFEIINLDCQDASVDITPGAGAKCIFNIIDSLDAKHVVLDLKIPSQGYITNPSVEYYVQYSYSGQRIANIPIIDETLKQPSGQFSRSSASIGPVVLDFELPVQRVTKQDSQTINEYWGIKDRPLEIKLKFSHIGTVSNVQPIKITAGNVKLDVKGTLTKAVIDGSPLQCDFDDSWASSEEVVVPTDVLVCNVMNTPFSVPQIWATIEANFDYVYQFRAKETVTVKQPT